MKKNTFEIINIKISDHQNAFLYKNKGIKPKAVLLYFHGGGLLYGNPNDLPDLHLEKFCENNYAIISFEYRLAPKYKLPDILSDVIFCINWYLDNRYKFFNLDISYFLWGRSAGAYLALLAAREKYKENPLGILSYYGYGFLEEFWSSTPNPHYNSLPKIDEESINNILSKEDKSINSRYALYVYARQKGTWLSLIYDEPIKYLLLKYSLRTFNNYQDYPPVFLTHSFYDPDVPCDESKSLHRLIPKSELFLVSSDVHDFDRYVEKSNTMELLERSLSFLNKNIARSIST
ncbi:alpha/beta hydrolase [Tissierella sp.]|uniref:alpha/beta hydrolase n=1 Tax=Tissierella sp. TaxID=41274 RepID=UPI002860224D|nr:alpha/beta hydrolase [Tissierella sp.]MDR7855279.1 alpha/beta hydrolase [Tissierella sp.]